MLKRRKSNYPILIEKAFPRPLSLTTKLIILTGIILVAIPFAFYANQSYQLSHNTPDVPEIAKTTAAPTEVEIPAVHIDLPIVQTVIKNKVWDIAPNGISHLAISANPEEQGPVILYGHNTNDRFGPIRWITKGATITLTTADHKQHDYIVSGHVTVSPQDMSVFFQRKTETLYLYTCDGFADLERYVIVAYPKINLGAES